MTKFTQYINAVIHTYDKEDRFARNPIGIEELSKVIVENRPIYESDPNELTLDLEYDDYLPFIKELQMGKLYAIFIEVEFTAWVNEDREGESEYKIIQFKKRELPPEFIEDFGVEIEQDEEF